MKSPKISVILPSFNAARYLRDAIDSILAQTFADFELIILNDGSTDDTDDIIRSYNDPRIQYIHEETNNGLVSVLNKGISAARGEFVARMDADDIAFPERLAVQLSYFDDAKVDVVCSPIRMIDVDKQIVTNWELDEQTMTEEAIRRTLPFSNCIAHPTVMIRRDVLMKFKYRREQRGSEDWDLWLRLVSNGHVIRKTKEPLLYYRYHPGSVTQSDNRRESIEKKIFKVRWRFINHALLNRNWSRTVDMAMYANIRTALRILKLNIGVPFMRTAKRLLTMNVIRAFRETSALADKVKADFNVLMVFPYSHVGGAERVHADIVKALDQFAPVVIFSGIQKPSPFIREFKKGAARVIEAGHALNHPLTASHARRIVDAAIRRQSHSITIFGSNAYYFYDLADVFVKLHRFIEINHDYTFDPNDHWSIGRIYQLRAMTRRVFVSSKAMLEAQKMYRFLGFADNDHNNLDWIVNATDVPPHLPERIISEKLRLLFVGRHSPEKRVHLVKEIARRLSDVAELQLVGDFSDSDKEVTISVSGVVMDANQLQAIYAQSDVILITSEREGFPMVIMEGMAQGAVPVSTPVGDIPAHIRHSENGILLDNRSPESVINSAVEQLRMLAANPEKLRQLRIATHKYALQNFSRQTFEEKYRALLIP